MFRTGSFILRLLLALVLLAGLVGLLAGAFRMGYSQGYVIGASADGESTSFAPGFLPHGRIMPYYGMHFFPPVGLFFCGAPLLFLAFLGLIFRPRHWHHHHPLHGACTPHHWAHEHHHGPEHAPEHDPENKPDTA